METNIGANDRKARVVIGAVLGIVSLGLLGNYIPGPEVFSPVLGVIALYILLTAYLRKSPIYSAMGSDTLEK